jgi:SAM-dependent methyltransferase
LFLVGGGRRLRPRLRRALDLASPFRGLRLVDVGAGRGEAAAVAARGGADVTAVDWSQDALGLARRSAEAAGSAVRLVVGRATELPLPDGYADRVLLLDVIEHLRAGDAAAALDEARRILRPGGYVVIHTLPNRWALAFGYRFLRLMAPSLPREPRSWYEKRVHVNEQDPLRLKVALMRAGLASRVWVEAWSARHAEAGAALQYPDRARSEGYPLLRRPFVRGLAGAGMAGPWRVLVGNDLFAIAWHPGAGPPTIERNRLAGEEGNVDANAAAAVR